MATADQRVDDPEPFREQEPFLYNTHRYYTYASGVGSGKTAVGLMRAALNVDVWNPGYMGAIIAPTSTMVKNVIFPLMSEFGIRQRWDYKGPQSEEPGFHAPNGSRILVLSADNERTIERLAGLNLAWWWVDEARDIPERAIQILIQRLRKGRYKNGFLTSTPRRNHLEDFAFKGIDESDGYKHGEAHVYESDKRLTITGVTPDANPYMSEEDIEAIRDGHPDALMQQEVQGRFVDIGGNVFTKDMIHFATPQDLPDRDRWKFVVGVDVGVEADSQRARDNDSDYWAASLLMQDTLQGDTYLVDCRRERGLTLKQGCEWIQGVTSTVESPEVYVESNQSQRWLKQELRDRGVRAHAVMNTSNKEDRLIQLTLPIERGDVEFLNRELDESLGYDPRFQELIGEMLSFPEGSHIDLLDSLEIAVNNLQIGGNSIMGGDLYGRGKD